MNLHRVSLFAEVVKAGGFTAAGRALDLPKSAVSAAVTRLEAELGVALLVRAGRKISLTEAGAALYARAAPALELLQESEQVVRGMRETLEGRIRLTAPPGLGTRILAPVVSRFLREHPGIRVEAVFTMRAVDLVGEGFDLALRAGPVVDEDLIAKPVGSGETGLFASPAYLARTGALRSSKHLAGREVLLLGAPKGSRQPLHLEGPRGPVVAEVDVRLAADHYPFVLAATLDGVGIGVLPVEQCEDELQAGHLVRVLPTFGQPAKPIYLVYPRHSAILRRVMMLRDRIIEHCGAAR